MSFLPSVSSFYPETIFDYCLQGLENIVTAKKGSSFEKEAMIFFSFLQSTYPPSEESFYKNKFAYHLRIAAYSMNYLGFTGRYVSLISNHSDHLVNLFRKPKLTLDYLESVA